MSGSYHYQTQGGYQHFMSFSSPYNSHTYGNMPMKHKEQTKAYEKPEPEYRVPEQPELYKRPEPSYRKPQPTYRPEPAYKKPQPTYRPATYPTRPPYNRYQPAYRQPEPAAYNARPEPAAYNARPEPAYRRREPEPAHQQYRHQAPSYAHGRRGYGYQQRPGAYHQQERAYAGQYRPYQAPYQAPARPAHPPAKEKKMMMMDAMPHAAAASANTAEPELKYLGSFGKTKNKVHGDIYKIDDHTLLVRGFSFGGGAPDVHFWSNGVSIPYYTR